MSLQVVSMRRYPVKSMGGEALNGAALDARGLTGDRWFAVEDEQGHFASGKSTRRFRRRDQVFNYHAATRSDGVTVTGGASSWAVGDQLLDQELSAALGTPVQVKPEAEIPHQDAGAVSLVGLATLRWCADRWGIDADPRRLRANIVFDGGEPFVEESWVGRRIQLGSVVLNVTTLTERCRMIDVPQDSVAPKTRWLTLLAEERALRLGVYADVATPGSVEVGDVLQLL